MAAKRNKDEWVVLIVDDAPDNVAVAQKVLSFHGADVHTAQDGQAGLEMLENIDPTFILLDLSMPVLDGWEMLKRIREHPEWQSITVIALTAHAMQGDRERVLKAGFDGYISKPFRLATFLNEIESCLDAIDSAT